MHVLHAPPAGGRTSDALPRRLQEAPTPRTTQPGLRACRHLQRGVQEHARLAWEDKNGRKGERIRSGVQGLSVRSRRACLFTVDNHARILAKRRGRSIREAEQAARQGQPARRVAPDPTEGSFCGQVCNACHLFLHADLHATLPVPCEPRVRLVQPRRSPSSSCCRR